MNARRVLQLRDAIVDMTIRYGQARQRCGSAPLTDSAGFDRWNRAASRRFRAQQRLIAALVEEATR